MITNIHQPQQNIPSMLIFDINISNLTEKKTLQLSGEQSVISTILTSGNSQCFGFFGKINQALYISKNNGTPIDYILKRDSKVVSQGTTAQSIHIPNDDNSIYQLILTNNTDMKQKQVLSIRVKEN